MYSGIRLFSCLFILLLTRTAFGCSIIVMPVTQFDLTEYVFIGEVVGYVGPERPTYSASEAWGVLVKADESVHSPKTPSGYFEVFTFDLQADCSWQGWSKEQVAGSHLLRSKVFVVAKESKMDAAGNANVRLVIAPGSNGTLSQVGAQGNHDSATSVYDYQAYTEAQEVLPLFELRKDLLRLRRASTEGEKAEVLKRLVYFPQKYIIDYKKIVELHLKDKIVAAQIMAKREAWERRPTNR